MREHPRIVDLLAIVACLIGQGAVGLREQGTLTGHFILVLAAASFALVWRRSSPMTVVAVVSLIVFLGMLFFPDATYQRIPAAVALYAVAARHRTSRALAGYGITVAFPILAGLILGLSGPVSFSPSLLDPLALLALAVGTAVKAHNDRRDALDALIDRRTQHAALAERARITAEMHDVVAHSITVMIALAGGARSAWDTQPERARQALEHLGDVGGAALDSMQRILKVLREGDPDLERALHTSGHNVQSLDGLIEVFRAAGLPVTLSRHGTLSNAEPALDTTIHRIIQESLTNALRYANGVTTVQVTITADPAFVELAITDDGRPHHTPPTGTGVGLTSIRERAATYDGSVQAGPLPGGGWSTRVHLPLHTRNA